MMGLLYERELTVATGQITGTQEATFVITEANVGSKFWNRVAADGGNIRLYAAAGGASRLAIDVVGINTGSQELQVHVLDTMAVADSVFLRLIEKTASQPSVTDTYGRNNAYRSDCNLWYSMNEDPSGTPAATDRTGTGNNASMSGSMTSADVVTGQVGDAIEYDGSDDYFEVTDDPSIQPANVTVMVWGYFDGVIGTDKDFPYILDKTDQTGGANNGYRLLGIKATPTLRFQVASGGTRTNVDAAWDDKTWTHTVGTYDGTDAKIYKNGTLADSAAHAAGIGDPTANMRVGFLSQGTLPTFDSNLWQGEIDEVAVFDAALTADEAEAFSNNQSNPGAFWDEGTEKVYGMPPMTGAVL